MRGFKFNGYKEGKYGVSIIYSEVPALVSATFTKNRVKAHPVILCQELLKKKEKFRAIVVNSGNANCYTNGGMEDAKKMQEIVSKLLNIEKEDILVASTGVIGRKMPMDIIEDRIKKAYERLKRGNNLEETAKAIMTTDTFPKYVVKKVGDVNIVGIAKGAGMIHPNMATMLCFVLTDVKIEKDELDNLLKEMVEKTFNRISVDGDTSTNDSVFIMANGLSNINYKEIKEEFDNALFEVFDTLARMIVKDGEGASKFMEVIVKGAKSKEDAEKACKSVINSLLVKTAVFGGDPNWGRILAAVGYSGADFNPEEIDIILKSGEEEVYLVKDGNVLADEGSEELKKAEKLMKNKEITFIIDLKAGTFEDKAYGCDLTYEYVRINSEYTT
ncbi:arginine biosynthesis bifunctional protein ArgJ [Methanocaldococcus infernus ME]|uniref:Glutamate N-acetyltransferase n=1 Tax=Methanocaldococcus infernus (strain DSM 11812 / JCM 15783 / ME) TaxID=573063 RepID=D5VR44_METIM|nr:bifunctional ornithine acetyltransferase/N-acetylglutamate synthase [Methanocaldococcus infernus]ADG13047.1 arginine biosynthesis bifunctional protein ArgJ [Methanocaldococcus infernus ME]